MSLPELCPLDGKSGCKTDSCHLYHEDWRSGDENCSIGYCTTQKSSHKTEQLQDTYAQNASLRLGREVPTTVQIRKSTQVAAKIATDESTAIQISDNREEAIIEDVVISDKNTTVIELNHAYDGDAIKSVDVSDDGNVMKERKKGKSIDDVMKFDLPDDYEEEFWS